jgi:limonene-1,2-epoxide hydrolase
MGATQEAVVRSLVESLNADDRDRVAAHYADDAVWHLSAWREPIVGKPAIRAMLDQLAGDGFRFTILNIASTDVVVLTELVDTHERDGRQITLHWSSVTELDQTGRIVAERDYWDSKELEAQLS